LARPLRIEYEGAFYRVTARGNERKRIFTAPYANYINRERERSGHLLQGRYKGISVDRDTYLRELSRYLHLNPVRAKIVESPEDYRQSSYRTYVTGEKDAMVTTDLLLGMVAGDGKTACRAYREFVEAGMGEGVRNPFEE